MERTISKMFIESSCHSLFSDRPHDYYYHPASSPTPRNWGVLCRSISSFRNVNCCGHKTTVQGDVLFPSSSSSPLLCMRNTANARYCSSLGVFSREILCILLVLLVSVVVGVCLSFSESDSNSYYYYSAPGSASGCFSSTAAVGVPSPPIFASSSFFSFPVPLPLSFEFPLPATYIIRTAMAAAVATVTDLTITNTCNKESIIGNQIILVTAHGQTYTSANCSVAASVSIVSSSTAPNAPLPTYVPLQAVVLTFVDFKCNSFYVNASLALGLGSSITFLRLAVPGQLAISASLDVGSSLSLYGCSSDTSVRIYPGIFTNSSITMSDARFTAGMFFGPNMHMFNSNTTIVDSVMLRFVLEGSDEGSETVIINSTISVIRSTFISGTMGLNAVSFIGSTYNVIASTLTADGFVFQKSHAQELIMRNSTIFMQKCSGVVPMIMQSTVTSGSLNDPTNRFIFRDNSFTTSSATGGIILSTNGVFDWDGSNRLNSTGVSTAIGHRFEIDLIDSTMPPGWQIVINASVMFRLSLSHFLRNGAALKIIGGSTIRQIVQLAATELAPVRGLEDAEILIEDSTLVSATFYLASTANVNLFHRNVSITLRRVTLIATTTAVVALFSGNWVDGCSIVISDSILTQNWAAGGTSVISFGHQGSLTTMPTPRNGGMVLAPTTIRITNNTFSVARTTAAAAGVVVASIVFGGVSRPIDPSFNTHVFVHSNRFTMQRADQRLLSIEFSSAAPPSASAGGLLSFRANRCGTVGSLFLGLGVSPEGLQSQLHFENLTRIDTFVKIAENLPSPFLNLSLRLLDHQLPFAAASSQTLPAVAASSGVGGGIYMALGTLASGSEVIVRNFKQQTGGASPAKPSVIQWGGQSLSSNAGADSVAVNVSISDVVFRGNWTMRGIISTASSVAVSDVQVISGNALFELGSAANPASLSSSPSATGSVFSLVRSSIAGLLTLTTTFNSTTINSTAAPSASAGDVLPTHLPRQILVSGCSIGIGGSGSDGAALDFPPYSTTGTNVIVSSSSISSTVHRRRFLLSISGEPQTDGAIRIFDNIIGPLQTPRSASAFADRIDRACTANPTTCGFSQTIDATSSAATVFPAGGVSIALHSTNGSGGGEEGPMSSLALLAVENNAIMAIGRDSDEAPAIRLVGLCPISSESSPFALSTASEAIVNVYGNSLSVFGIGVGSSSSHSSSSSPAVAAAAAIVVRTVPPHPLVVSDGNVPSTAVNSRVVEGLSRITIAANTVTMLWRLTLQQQQQQGSQQPFLLLLPLLPSVMCLLRLKSFQSHQTLLHVDGNVLTLVADAVDAVGSIGKGAPISEISSASLSSSMNSHVATLMIHGSGSSSSSSPFSSSSSSVYAPTGHSSRTLLCDNPLQLFVGASAYADAVAAAVNVGDIQMILEAGLNAEQSKATFQQKGGLLVMAMGSSTGATTDAAAAMVLVDATTAAATYQPYCTLCSAFARIGQQCCSFTAPPLVYQQGQGQGQGEGVGSGERIVKAWCPRPATAASS